VAEEFKAWLATNGFDLRSIPEIGWFHHGARLTCAHAAPVNISVARVAQHAFVLMVGTIEPRKGYALVLDAFDAIWREGHAMHLVIVGRPGWNVKELIARLHNHPQLGERLHWFDSADDKALDVLYDAAAGVLIASEAEGFGLPIVEAAIHGKALLVRDIPVFREVAGDGATYFRAETPLRFIDELRGWLRCIETGTAVPSEAITVQTWAQSAHRLLSYALPSTPPTF
jgi:glycosyltransferase involved in cell wall biosynthesis